jgi:hypothetical protein
MLVDVDQIVRRVLVAEMAEVIEAPALVTDATFDGMVRMGSAPFAVDGNFNTSAVGSQANTSGSLRLRTDWPPAVVQTIVISASTSPRSDTARRTRAGRRRAEPCGCPVRGCAQGEVVSQPPAAADRTFDRVGAVRIAATRSLHAGAGDVGSAAAVGVGGEAVGVHAETASSPARRRTLARG